MKKLFFILFSAVLTFSCSSDEAVEPNPPIDNEPTADEQYELMLGQWKPYSYMLTGETTSEGIIENWDQYTEEVKIEGDFDVTEVTLPHGDEGKLAPLEYYLRFDEDDRFDITTLTGDNVKETTWTYYEDIHTTQISEPAGIGFFVKSISGVLSNTAGRVLKVTEDELIFTQNTGLGYLDQGGYIILRFKRS